MHKLRIAVVEDDGDDSDFFCTALQEKYTDLDIQVFGAGDHFLNFIQSGETLPDLVVTDLRMPLVSGFDVISALRNNNDSKDIPIMVLSTSSSQEDKEKAAAMGVLAYFVKPYTYREYSEITDEIMEKIRRKKVD